MTIAVGDKLPQVTFRVMTPDGPALKATDEVFSHRIVLLVGVTAAFSPVCHEQHIPEYLEKLPQLREKGVQTIAVTSSNDVFVMDAWSKAMATGDKILFLSDGNNDFTRATGLSTDASGFGLGVRSRRYAMLVDDGVVKVLNIEDTPATAETSSAARILEALDVKA